MSLKDAYEDLLNKEAAQDSRFQFLKEMETVYPWLNEQNVDHWYKRTLPVRKGNAEEVFRDAAGLIEDRFWKKTRKTYSAEDCYSEVGTYYEGFGVNNKRAGDTIMVCVNDTVGQIRWPDGTVHIYDSGLKLERRIPDKEIGLFDTMKELKNRHKKKIGELKKECLERTDSLLGLRTGSDEYIRLTVFDGDRHNEIVLFRDGNAYCDYEYLTIDGSFVKQLAATIRAINGSRP